MKNKINLHYLKNPLVSIGLFIQIATLVTFVCMIRNGQYKGIMSDEKSYAIASGCGLILGCMIYKYFLDEECGEGNLNYQRLANDYKGGMNYFYRDEKEEAQDLLRYKISTR